MTQPLSTSPESNLDTILEQCAEAARSAGRQANEVQLIAVSKNHEASRILQVVRHWLPQGHPILGESYVQEALPKVDTVNSMLSEQEQQHTAWHFIGHIQSRKAKEIVGRFALIHSVDSRKVATNLHKEWEKRVNEANLPANSLMTKPQRILLQVNIGQEEQKSGVAPQDAEALCLDIMPLKGICIEGLMCIPPVAHTAEENRPYFAAMRELQDQLRTATGLALPHLSMGMSDDFTVAIAEGATLVRVGTRIFGSRT